jgi:NCS1 family nucleobase:cation symporter-1
VIRKGAWKVPDLYRGGLDFVYWYTYGINFRAWFVYVTTVVPSLRKSPLKS